MAWSDCLLSGCCGGRSRSRTKFYTCQSSSMGTRSCIGDEGEIGDGEQDSLVEVAQEAIDQQFVFLQQHGAEFRIANPAVPYYGELKAALTACNGIIIEGTVDCIATRLSVNLACGEGPTCDLAFHLNPRFDQNYVARNCRISGHWGDEEGAVPYRTPFARGTQFAICIFISDDEFLVSVNGRHFCAYTFRIPLHRVTRIEIHGDVTISLIELKPVHVYPELGPLTNQTVLKVPLSANISSHAVTPFIGRLPSKFTVGHTIEFIGRVKLLPNSFYINLQKGHNTWPHPKIPLHVNPHFRTGSGCIVTINTWKLGQWGSEVKAGVLRFRPGRQFSLRVSCCEDEYTISVDGQDMKPFKHRDSPHLVDHLVILGDVHIIDVLFSKS